MTISVTIALAEKISKFKLIKFYLKYIVSHERLRGLTILLVKKDMLKKLNYKSLINNLVSQKVRKIKFRKLKYF